MSGFQFNYLQTNILHTTIDNLVVANIKNFTGILTMPLISHCHLNRRFFYIELVPQYLTFMIFYIEFPVSLSIYEYSTYNNGQFGACLI